MREYHQTPPKSKTNYPTPTHCSPLIRVSRRNPCPICDKPDNCNVSADQRFAYCRRVPSTRQGRDGGWTHFLLEENFPANAPSSARPVKQRPAQTIFTEAPRASIEHCAAVYEALNKHLVLAKEHEAKLLERGLDRVTIKLNGYASTPPPAYAANVARALAPMQLEGVPGFYREHGQWRMVRMDQGFFVPVRDIHARICGLMIRRDDVVGRGKYIWLSSRDRDGGASSGAPANYANPYKLREADEIVITEGALKSQIIACLSGSPVIGIAGISAFSADFAAHLRDACPHLRRVAIAYDRDLLEKEEVYNALLRLTAQLEKASFRVCIRTWQPPAKGYDDFLLSQLTRREVSAA